MTFTNAERDLILAGLFELTITYDEKRERCKALARKLGGDPDATVLRRGQSGVLGVRRQSYV